MDSIWIQTQFFSLLSRNWELICWQLARLKRRSGPNQRGAALLGCVYLIVSIHPFPYCFLVDTLHWIWVIQRGEPAMMLIQLLLYPGSPASAPRAQIPAWARLEAQAQRGLHPGRGLRTAWHLPAVPWSTWPLPAILGGLPGLFHQPYMYQSYLKDQTNKNNIILWKETQKLADNF